ncbi:hypothetical protein ACIBAH_35030 [Streptomyces sp. NPDC051445]|uniref:hypothetical protein n=1 Tax=Streptomyces sp. NPDC051445 TaxID=3365653 RepID=UPI00378A0C8F
MAEAKKLEETVIKGITLELSPEEAEALYTVVGNVLGNRGSSPRRHTDHIYSVLRRVGLKGTHHGKASGSIKFEDDRPKSANW